VTVYEVTNTFNEFTAMHSKVAVLGRTDIRVITDAANWSKSGLGSSTSKATNTESALFIEPHHDGGRLGRRYLAAFMRTLDRYADQSTADGEPHSSETAAELMALGGWPKGEIAFVADEAYTSWGESIRVLGDLPELGVWGSTSLGVPLWTDGETYPTWMPEHTIALPIGTAFEYKLVAEMDGAIRWEAGDNHLGVAMPPAWTADELAEYRGTWRW
jgi:hypothetical protein